eukprot:13888659-Alexandrium_andersonii.AAC.1
MQTCPRALLRGRGATAPQRMVIGAHLLSPLRGRGAPLGLQCRGPTRRPRMVMAARPLGARGRG